MNNKVVIIGASITGIYTMNELVKQDYQGRITIIDQHDGLPYNPYPLTKDWMQDMDKVEPPLIKKAEYYKKHKIDLHLNTKVVAVDPSKMTVTTDKGDVISYDKLVIATGSKLRKISIPNDDADGIFYLRPFTSAKEIKAWAKHVKKVAIIGAGFIGLELASTFRQLDKEVSVLVNVGRPLENILGSDVSDYFVKMHQDHGVEFFFDEETETFIKDEQGKVKAILTKNGKTIETDMVIIAIGVVPNLSFDVEGLDMERGTIIVNEYNETSIDNIYAGGDIVAFPYQERLIHIEHWENAWSQGASIAKNILSKRSTKYEVTPYFWTDQYDQTFEYLGNTRVWDHALLRGSLDDKKFTIAYVNQDNKPLAILFANNMEKRSHIQALLNKHEALDPKWFADVNQSLKPIE